MYCIGDNVLLFPFTYLEREEMEEERKRREKQKKDEDNLKNKSIPEHMSNCFWFSTIILQIEFVNWLLFVYYYSGSIQ